ncbi:hypothetical protein [Mesorhizobium sp. ZC-5]|uniref:hypothetical protein n=1 Tax=Mesorhizobium sp. ZC-5 TaxID=2986066 RepID=UPI0021E6EDA0|nr:hypothetical protein [Mesorhizobium sp. ZC-5]MCV3243768.1 hypothetical protein [Mesorhizobium sp. ZC-5]
MDWSAAIERERQVLKRIVALFCALAALCDRICTRSRPARRLVLWILRPAEAAALERIAEAGPAPLALLWQRGDSLAEARRLSRCFRAAARAVKREIEALDRCGAGAMRRGCAALFGASFGRRFAGRDRPLRNLAPATAGLSRYPSAPGPPMPERLDTS